MSTLKDRLRNQPRRSLNEKDLQRPPPSSSKPQTKNKKKVTAAPSIINLSTLHELDDPFTDDGSDLPVSEEELMDPPTMPPGEVEVDHITERLKYTWRYIDGHFRKTLKNQEMMKDKINDIDASAQQANNMAANALQIAGKAQRRAESNNDEIQTIKARQDEQATRNENRFRSLRRKTDDHERDIDTLETDVRGIRGQLAEHVQVLAEETQTTEHLAQKVNTLEQRVNNAPNAPGGSRQPNKIDVMLLKASNIIFSEQNRLFPHDFIQRFEHFTDATNAPDAHKAHVFTTVVTTYDREAWMTTLCPNDSYENTKKSFLQFYWNERAQDRLEMACNNYDCATSLQDLIGQLIRFTIALSHTDRRGTQYIIRAISVKLPPAYQMMVQDQNQTLEQFIAKLRELAGIKVDFAKHRRVRIVPMQAKPKPFPEWQMQRHIFMQGPVPRWMQPNLVHTRPLLPMLMPPPGQQPPTFPTPQAIGQSVQGNNGNQQQGQRPRFPQNARLQPNFRFQNHPNRNNYAANNNNNNNNTQNVSTPPAVIALPPPPPAIMPAQFVTMGPDGSTQFVQNFQVPTLGQYYEDNNLNIDATSPYYDEYCQYLYNYYQQLATNQNSQPATISELPESTQEQNDALQVQYATLQFPQPTATHVDSHVNNPPATASTTQPSTSQTNTPNAANNSTNTPPPAATPAGNQRS
ncbi:unnamed protein product [Allacma fusca]|uniref:Uncharacterized protein n=1 Tax=Allacma fusca TaxID=39272 RepID=A0A8J2PIL8_9HEXA|nr:unnamed protein product [Allacma fusca]